MGSGLLSPTHLAVVLAVVLIVFGPKRLPELGRALGSGMRTFKDALDGDHDPEDEPAAVAPPAAQTPPPAVEPAAVAPPGGHTPPAAAPVASAAQPAVEPPDAEAAAAEPPPLGS